MKIGKLEIIRDLMLDYEKSNVIFSQLGFVPLHVEFLGWKDTYVITGISYRFEHIEPGAEPPTYAPEMHTDDEGNITMVSV